MITRNDKILKLLKNQTQVGVTVSEKTWELAKGDLSEYDEVPDNDVVDIFLRIGDDNEQNVLGNDGL